MRLSIDIEADDEVTPWLASIARDIQGGKNVNGVNGFIARNVGKSVREYLVREAPKRHKTADRLGGKRTGHLERGAEDVQARPDESGIIVNLPIPGIRRAFEDVTLLPIRSKYLTLPATGEAYGRRARSFSDLRFVPFKRGAVPALVRKVDGKMEVLFWLKRSVFQRQDRTLLPSDEALLQAAEEGAEEYLDFKQNERTPTT